MTFPTNYDTRAIGVPYIRAHRLGIEYPPPNSGQMPVCDIAQSWAVKLADGTIEPLRGADTIRADLNIADPAMFPLVDNDSGEPLNPAICQALGAMVASGSVNMAAVLALVLAAVRSKQVA